MRTDFNMKQQKLICIIILLSLFVLFFIYQYNKRTTFEVLKVYNPLTIGVDKNRNGTVDDGEIITVLDGYSIINKEDITNHTKYPSLNTKTKSAFYFLSDKYSKDLLLDKRVELKQVNNKNEIIVNKEPYSNILLKSGYIFQSEKPTNKDTYNKRLNQISKADYKIYNPSSNKYHELDCEYGLASEKVILLTKAQLPKGAKPCEVCVVHKKKKHSYNIHNKYDIPSPPMIYSSGAIKIFLSDHTRKLKPDRLGNTELCNELVRQINSAKSTIDIAIYGYDKVPKIEKAIKNAIARGVKVRLVYDIDSKGENIYSDTDYLVNIINNSQCDTAPSNIKNPSKYTNSIMHNKFYIFDKSTVIAGSANMSFTDMSGFNSNCLILIRSKQIADIYTKEFEQMFNKRFHNLKSKIDNKENIQLGKSNLSIYFSPTDSIIDNAIIPYINKAEKYIYMPVFLITEKHLTNALIRAKQRGVDIKIIVDATNAKNDYSKHKLLRANGILVKTENYAGKLHSKSIIIDDKYTFIGSMNFSNSGVYKNDENVILIKDSGLTMFYKKYFLYIWNRINNYWSKHDVSAESIYSIGSCSDGIDNDYDGKTDNEDEGCKMKPKKH